MGEDSTSRGDVEHPVLAVSGSYPFEGFAIDEVPPGPSRFAALNLSAFCFDFRIATSRFLHEPALEQWTKQVLLRIQYEFRLYHAIREHKAPTVLVALATAIYHSAQSPYATTTEYYLLHTSCMNQTDTYFVSEFQAAQCLASIIGMGGPEFIS